MDCFQYMMRNGKDFWVTPPNPFKKADKREDDPNDILNRELIWLDEMEEEVREKSNRI